MNARGRGKLRTAAHDQHRLRALLDELETLRPAGTSSISDVLGRLRELAQVESIVCASPVQTISGWALDQFHADDLASASRLRRLFASYLVRVTGAFGWFDPLEPEIEQRNMLVDLRERIRDDEFQASRICVEVLRPLQLHRHHVVRALVCRGDSLLAWVGVFHPGRLSAQQHAILDGALPALQRRLDLERQLETAPLLEAALDAGLHDIAAPALVMTSSGRIVDGNDAGRAMLATVRGELSQSILAALAHETGPLPIELTPLNTDGAADAWLAVVRTHSCGSPSYRR